MKETLNGGKITFGEDDKDRSSVEVETEGGKLWKTEAQNLIMSSAKKDLNQFKDAFESSDKTLADMKIVARAGDTLGALTLAVDRAAKSKARALNKKAKNDDPDAEDVNPDVKIDWNTKVYYYAVDENGDYINVINGKATSVLGCSLSEAKQLYANDLVEFGKDDDGNTIIYVSSSNKKITDLVPADTASTDADPTPQAAPQSSKTPTEQDAKPSVAPTPAAAPAKAEPQATPMAAPEARENSKQSLEDRLSSAGLKVKMAADKSAIVGYKNFRLTVNVNNKDSSKYDCALLNRPNSPEKQSETEPKVGITLDEVKSFVDKFTFQPDVVESYKTDLINNKYAKYIDGTPTSVNSGDPNTYEVKFVNIPAADSKGNSHPLNFSIRVTLDQILGFKTPTIVSSGTTLAPDTDFSRVVKSAMDLELAKIK